MATYNGWTELREYRVWASEDIYACVTIERHRNGWISVYEDGSEEVYKTRSEEWAFRYALDRMLILETEASNACLCKEWSEEGQEACEDAARNVYGYAHGVRSQVVDMEENRSLDEYEL